jgi:ABC-type uncharacterized transport system ATPase subunit
VDRLLVVENLTRSFDGVRAVDDVSLSLEAGSMRAIIGPNGCGKTTLFNMITGYLKPDAGRILFKGRDIAGLGLHEIARAGIVRKFQVPSVFGGLTVAQNLEAAGSRDIAGGLAHAGLAARAQDLAGTLSHGETQWLELAMVIACEPALVLLDEPAAGMTKAERARTVELLKELHTRRELAILLIEHDMSFIDALDCPVSVMALGRVIAEGEYEALKDDLRVREAYLGGADA